MWNVRPGSRTSSATVILIVRDDERMVMFLSSGVLATTSTPLQAHDYTHRILAPQNIHREYLDVAVSSVLPSE